MTSPVPVAIFAYARPSHLQKVLASLKKNSVPRLYAYSDGPRNEDQESLVNEVSQTLKRIDWCEVTIIERERNYGLGPSIRDGISRILSEHDRVIVVEDDTILRPGAYDYVVAALRQFENDSRIMTISMWNHPSIVPDQSRHGFFSKRFVCWGWGTYKWAWKKYDRTPLDLYHLCEERNIRIYKSRFFSTQGQCGISFVARDYFDERKDIHLGNDVWIGDRVFIRDGISIGNGAVVGAGAVVVDNGPDYAIVAGVPAKLIRSKFPEDVIDERAQRHISIRDIHIIKIGLSFARNKGGQSALCDYVGYIDDDARANPQYIETLLKGINEQKPEIRGSPFYPFYLSSKPHWFFDKYGTLTRGDVPYFLISKEYLGGGNIIFHRSLLDEVGWFDPSVGLRGKKLVYGEETMVIIKAWERRPNLRVYYDPDIFVYHLFPAWKMSVLNWLRISYKHGRSQAYFWIPNGQIHTARLHAPIDLPINLSYSARRFSSFIMSRNRKEFPFWQNFIIEKFYPCIESLGVDIQLTQDLLFSWMKKS